jgi:CheY-like chemotaxis protein
VSGDPPGEPIRVFVLDDQEIVRRGVRCLLEAEPDIRVIGEAGTASAALARIPALHPDVAVLDIRLPDGSGVSVCREARSRVPEMACLMLTAFNDDQALLDAIMAGAAGCVLSRSAAPIWPTRCARPRPAVRCCPRARPAGLSPGYGMHPPGETRWPG